MVKSAADHVVAVCHYLAHCARSRHVSTRLHISGATSYAVDDGCNRYQYSLPAGVTWGACAGVYGPPSKPIKVVTESVVGGRAEDGGVFMEWSSSGAYTPGTLYLHSGAYCCAITLPRAVHGVVHMYSWSEGKWVMRSG